MVDQIQVRDMVGDEMDSLFRNSLNQLVVLSSGDTLPAPITDPTQVSIPEGNSKRAFGQTQIPKVQLSGDPLIVEALGQFDWGSVVIAPFGPNSITSAATISLLVDGITVWTVRVAYTDTYAVLPTYDGFPTQWNLFAKAVIKGIPAGSHTFQFVWDNTDTNRFNNDVEPPLFAAIYETKFDASVIYTTKDVSSLFKAA